MNIDPIQIVIFDGENKEIKKIDPMITQRIDLIIKDISVCVLFDKEKIKSKEKLIYAVNINDIPFFSAENNRRFSNISNIKIKLILEKNLIKLTDNQDYIERWFDPKERRVRRIDSAPGVIDENEALWRCQQLVQKKPHLHFRLGWYNRHGVLAKVEEESKVFFSTPFVSELTKLTEANYFIESARNGDITVYSFDEKRLHDGKLSFIRGLEEGASLNEEDAHEIILCPKLKADLGSVSNITKA